MDLIFDLLILAFFGPGELLVCHSEICRLVSGSYSKIHDSSPVMTCLKTKIWSFSMRSRKSSCKFIRFSFCSLVRILGTSFAQIFPLPNSSGQNFVDSSVIQIQLTTDHSDCQTSIIPHESPHFGHIFVRF